MPIEPKRQELFFRSYTIPYSERTPTATHHPLAIIRDINRHPQHTVEEFFDIPNEHMDNIVGGRTVTYTEQKAEHYPHRYFHIDYLQIQCQWATTFPEGYTRYNFDSYTALRENVYRNMTDFLSTIDKYNLLGAVDIEFSLKTKHLDLLPPSRKPVDCNHITTSQRSKQIITTNSFLYVLIFLCRLMNTIQQHMPHNGQEFGFVTGILRAANPLTFHPLPSDHISIQTFG